MPRTSNLQRAGWVITLIGVSSFAVASPLSAWLTRHSYTAFSFSVGWANVLSTVLTALGLIMSIGDKLGALSVKDNENLASIADGLTRHALRQDSALLAQLLGTDSLDNRPARDIPGWCSARPSESEGKALQTSDQRVREYR